MIDSWHMKPRPHPAITITLIKYRLSAYFFEQWKEVATRLKGYLEMKSEVGAFWLTCSDLFDALAACRTSDYSSLTCEMKRSRSLKQTCI